MGINANMNTPLANNKFENILYLRLSDVDIDTLDIQVAEVSNGAYISKFVYNDVIIFNDSESRSTWNEIIVK